MATQHKSSESVRAYLLGTLKSRDASDLEVSYFTDPDRLNWIRGIEEELIADYLERRLSTEDVKRFEARYLQVPALRMKLEEVRARLRPAPRQSWLSIWAPLRVAAMSACVLAMAGGAWFYLRHPSVPSVSVVHAPASSPARIVSVLDIPLSPGVRMGGGARQAEVSVPPGGANVSFTLELPGRTKPLDCSVRFLSVNPDGSRRLVWTSPTLRSQATPSGGSLTVTPDSSTLPPADYMIEVVATDGSVLETYVVRLDPQAAPPAANRYAPAAPNTAAPAPARTVPPAPVQTAAPADVAPTAPIVAPPPAAAEPKTIESGMSRDQVMAIMGPPRSITRAGAKEIFTYNDLKVTFVNGKITDIQ